MRRGLLTAASMLMAISGFADSGLQQRLQDEHAKGADHWIYNDIAAGFKKAKETGKPLFVTFRCVPCKACKGFDAEVAKGNDELIKKASRDFICVRQVEMKGVDLGTFQFDYDLNWAGMFLNADGTVYARYGTQSSEGPDAYNSVASLTATMNRVLGAHRIYPQNSQTLAHKAAKAKPYRSALDMPGLKDREKFKATTERKNCIHCHNIHDAENRIARTEDPNALDFLWRYPLPENIGLEILRDHGRRIKSVIPGSPAERAGVRPRDEVVYLNLHWITSIADMQWAMHEMPPGKTEIVLQVKRGSKLQPLALQLEPGWKKTDISWRGSMWSLDPKLGFWAVPLTESQRKNHKIDAGKEAYLIKWINTSIAAGREVKKAGLREGDIWVGIDGKPITRTMKEINIDLRLNHKPGETLPLSVKRNGKVEELTVTLVNEP